MDIYELLFSLSIMCLFGFQLWQSRKQAKSKATSPTIIEIYKRQRRLVILYIFITGIVYISLDTITPEMLLFLTFSLLFAIIIFEIVPLKVTLNTSNMLSTDLTNSTTKNKETPLSDTHLTKSSVPETETIRPTNNRNNTNQNTDLNSESELDTNLDTDLDLDLDLDTDVDLDLNSDEEKASEN